MKLSDFSLKDLLANLVIVGTLFFGVVIFYLDTVYAPAALATEFKDFEVKFDSKELADILYRIELLEDEIAYLESFLFEDLTMYQRTQLSTFRSRLERYLDEYTQKGGERYD